MEKNKQKYMKLNTSIFPLLSAEKASKGCFSFTKMETPTQTAFFVASVFSINYQQFNGFSAKAKAENKSVLFAILN